MLGNWVVGSGFREVVGKSVSGSGGSRRSGRGRDVLVLRLSRHEYSCISEG